MSENRKPGRLNRREFVQMAGAIAVAGVGQPRRRQIALVVDPADAVANMQQVKWAIGELEASLRSKGISVNIVDQLVRATNTDLRILLAGPNSAIASLVEAKRPRGSSYPPRQSRSRSSRRRQSSSGSSSFTALMHRASFMACLSSPTVLASLPIRSRH